MAGIGFELRGMLQQGTVAGALKGYGYASVISSGPWILSIFSLVLLGIVLSTQGFEDDLSRFFVAVTHIYGFSLILTGPVQMILTRFAADYHFKKQEEKVFPALFTALAMTSVLATLIGLPVFVFLMPGAFVFQLSCAFTFVVICCIWITSVFLTAVRQHNLVALSFAGGYLCSFAAAWGLTLLMGSSYTMLGYASGQVLLLLLFVLAVSNHYGAKEFLNLDFLPYFRRHWPLALVGLFYNLGIWADKLIHWWFSPLHQQVAGVFYSAPLYDTAVYLSFLSIVPGMAVFLVKLETGYAENHEAFFDAVLKKQTLDEIEGAKDRMISALRDGLGRLVKIQALVTLSLIAAAGPLLGALGLGSVQTGIFRITLLGVFLLVLLLSLLTILFYLDQTRSAMKCCIAFAGANIALTSWNVIAGDHLYGTGFVIAAAIAIIPAVVAVNHHHADLEFHTFTSQKLS